MTEEQRQRLERAIQEGYFHSSSIRLGEGLRMYRMHFRHFALFALLLPFLGSVFTLLGLGGAGTLVLMLLIAPVLNAGFYLAAHGIVEGLPWDFRRFFTATPKALPLIVNSFLGVLITALVLTPMFYLLQKTGFVTWYYEVVANPVNPPEPPLMSSTDSTIFLLNLVPLVYLQVGFSWSFPMILFMGANPFSALEYSRRLINRRWWAQFMLLFTFFSMFMLAAMLLSPLAGISPGLANLGSFGLFLLLPWAYCSLYIGFRGALKPAEGD